MDPAKRQRCRENDDVAWFEGIHRFFVTVEPNELAVLDIDPITTFFLYALKAAIELAFEDIGHGHQLDWPAVAGGERVIGRAAAAAAATHQRHLDHITSGGMDMGDGHCRQGRSRGDAASGFDKFATC